MANWYYITGNEICGAAYEQSEGLSHIFSGNVCIYAESRKVKTKHLNKSITFIMDKKIPLRHVQKICTPERYLFSADGPNDSSGNSQK